MDPRISFSYGFADVQQQATSSKQDAVFRGAVASSAPPDFEFSTPPMASFGINGCAEELFFEGKILPSRASNKVPTLQDELLVDDDDNGSDDVRGRKGWRERFGFSKNRAQRKPDTIFTACSTQV